MDPKMLEEAKDILRKLKESHEPNGVLKRATLLAVVLGFVQSSSVLAADKDVNKLVTSLTKSNVMNDRILPWNNGNHGGNKRPGHGNHGGGWKDWKDWKDWSDWKDWKNWNDWKDWKNWNDWRDWKNY